MTFYAWRDLRSDGHDVRGAAVDSVRSYEHGPNVRRPAAVMSPQHIGRPGRPAVTTRELRGPARDVSRRTALTRIDCPNMVAFEWRRLSGLPPTAECH